jgi:hypothetical protein
VSAYVVRRPELVCVLMLQLSACYGCVKLA